MNSAIIAKIDKIIPIPGADTIQTAIVLGDQVIVSKQWTEGMIGVLFPEGLQLSHEYCHNNNLYRDSTLNLNNAKKGFFDNNRRVRCQPFMKVKSEAYFAELSSLSFTGVDLETIKDLHLGYSFTECNGVEICKKYISEKTKKASSDKVNVKKKTGGVSVPNFYKHVDTDQFNYYVSKIKEGDLLSFHSKKHGTSFRVGYTKVEDKMPLWKCKINNIAHKLIGRGLFKPTWKWDYICGTRNVILENPNKEGFHGSESYRFAVMEQLKPFLVKGMNIYGEIYGWVNGKPIMGTHNTDALKDKAFKRKYGDSVVYSYGCKEGTYDFHIYRIQMVNEDGYSVDFTDAQIKDWCGKYGFNATIDVHPPMVFNGDYKSLEELVHDLTERSDLLTEDYTDPSHISEGIIIRVDNGNTTPTFYKSKSYAFKVMEGIFKEDNVDEEDSS